MREYEEFIAYDALTGDPVVIKKPVGKDLEEPTGKQMRKAIKTTQDRNDRKEYERRVIRKKLKK